MNDTARNVESKPRAILDANRTEPNYPWADPNWRSRVDSSHSGPALNLGGSPVSEPDYPWLKQPVQRQSEPLRQPQPINRERMPFGQRIRELRRARGWTQRQAGYALGVSTRTVIRHERGYTRRPWWTLLETVRRLEAAYAGELSRRRPNGMGWTVLMFLVAGIPIQTPGLSVCPQSRLCCRSNTTSCDKAVPGM